MMPNEPKFKGLSIDGSSWCYGHGWYKLSETEALLVRIEENVICHLDSMGQYLGLDCDGVEAYSGDVLQPSNREEIYYYIVQDGYGFVKRYDFLRVYHDRDRTSTYPSSSDTPLYLGQHRVVGNIAIDGKPFHTPVDKAKRYEPKYQVSWVKGEKKKLDELQQMADLQGGKLNDNI